MTREEALAQLTAPGAPFEISEESVRGAKVRVFANAPRSLRALFALSAAHAERCALVYDGERWSYAELHERVARLAAVLAGEAGVARGDRIAIAMRNYPEWSLAFWAVQCLGAVAVPLNAWWSGPELVYALQHSGARAAILDGERCARLSEHRAELGSLVCYVTRAAAPLPPGFRSLDAALAAAPADARLPDVPIEPDDDASILYTSGTTGRPKGAVHSQRNHLHNVWNAVLASAIDQLAGGPTAASDAAPRQLVSLQTFPLFHIAGLGILQAQTLAGAKIVLLYKWEPLRALELIERERVSWVAGVPTVMRSLLEAPERARFDLSSLASLGAGGAPVPPDLVRRIGRDFRSRVAPLNGYGLTETTSSVVSNVGAEYLATPESVGRPNATARVRIARADGSEAAPGEVGEIWLGGPQVVRGYWNDEKATAEAFRDGWFRSGDLGRVDERGRLHVVDRLKDMVIRGGENVYCAEVEARLFEHPAVADVAVIGLPHRELGEEVVAVIQPRAGHSPSPEAIRDFAAERLAAFKVPSQIVLRDEPLPRNAVGKVLKRELRDALRAN
jgi:acyl-CoA synthetase (AMP-forming)/AMP-acid ligase II